MPPISWIFLPSRSVSVSINAIMGIVRLTVHSEATGNFQKNCLLQMLSETDKFNDFPDNTVYDEAILSQLKNTWECICNFYRPSVQYSRRPVSPRVTCRLSSPCKPCYPSALIYHVNNQGTKIITNRLSSNVFMDYFAIWRYFGWAFGILSLGSLALEQWGICTSFQIQQQFFGGKTSAVSR